MATKRDLVEAHSANRRRLVAAFVGGVPGGREVDPLRPGRALVGSAALTVLLLAAAAASGILTGRSGDDWLDVGLVVSEENGTPYVITRGEDPVLRPVVNTTSARLILGPDLDTTTVSQQDIDAHAVGAEIGILGAPSSLPPPSLLVDSGWTACTADGAGTRVRVAEVPGAVPLPHAAAVVRVRGGGDVLLVATATDRLGRPQAFRYSMPDRAAERDRFLRALDLPESSAAVEVDAGFVDLFAEGSAVVRSALGLEGEGTPVDYGGGVFDGLVVGDVVASGADTFLLAHDGPVTLDPFAAALALAGAGGPAVQVGPVGATVERRYPLDWPDDRPDDQTGGGPTPAGTDLCAVLVTHEDEPPTVLVGGLVEADAAADAGRPSGAVAPGERSVTVQAGRGALVLSGGLDGAEAGRPFVVDARGVRHELVGPDAVTNLGHADHSVRVVPDTWLELFTCGVALSREAALRPPTTTAVTCS